MHIACSIAAVLAVLVALIHSVMGEVLIFRHLRAGTLVPTRAAAPLRERHVRILWASWHIASVFGLTAAAILWRAADASQPDGTFGAYAVSAVSLGMAASSLLVLVGTRGRHPGWLGLLAVALFAAWGLFAR